MTFNVYLFGAPLPPGATASIDLAMGGTATLGSDYAPALADALAAAVLPTGVSVAGTTLLFTDAYDPSGPTTYIPVPIIFSSVIGAPVEGLETLIMTLSNPVASSGGPINVTSSGTVYITEPVPSTVKPTHTSTADVAYPEPDPVNPGETVPGYTWRFISNTAPVFAEFGNSKLEGTLIYDPLTLDPGEIDLIQTIFLGGAALGDIVTVSFSKNLNGALLAAWVGGVGVVNFQFRNPTASPLTLGVGTVKVRVSK